MHYFKLWLVAGRDSFLHSLKVVDHHNTSLLPPNCVNLPAL